MTYHLPALRAALEQARAAAPRLPMAVGGLAFTWVPGLEKELNVTFHGRDARALVALPGGSRGGPGGQPVESR
jgi:hypothetical protein